jgi:hypothetical protein
MKTGYKTEQTIAKRRRHRAGESRRVAPAHGTGNQFRRSGNRVHRFLADYAGAAEATSVATALPLRPCGGRINAPRVP